MCMSVYTEEAQVIGDEVFLAPTSSRLRPFGVGLVQTDWDEGIDDFVNTPSYEQSRGLTLDEAIQLRDALSEAIAHGGVERRPVDELAEVGAGLAGALD
jgi:hypothetical protein